jgi:hypothetical protein
MNAFIIGAPAFRWRRQVESERWELELSVRNVSLPGIGHGGAGIDCT